ncbi:hypothetical protein METBIDRAFT_73442 [Metschnikowia bicuspidata var. bicuspidata NRRL YB-4993]|uniref:Uncharacterized protein n=1 Tax=Metschnikowia bicuspidata var. bicuspidata NRRL YB-4993 TaxID=869754 RepID=A0A1A0H5T0_9ASCO|nr:hypothetical protein METBIDRAFT_73442 [Metschnikowia bicuspidata var. bicuspidata NRRL YB-4993]OBA19444.1 hypothetical protein METBIDRAFT_73442 [Metschnikowia bicuspidata var. bicuspidata NRRL YB-4993]
MSKYTLSRIPKDVQYIFKVYETASHSFRPFDDKLVGQFVDRTGLYYEMFNRRKLLSDGTNGPIFNKQDFPLVTRDIVLTIFETPLQLEKKLDIPTDFLALSDLSPFADLEPVFSDWQTTVKHFSDHQARILSLLAAHFSPLSAVESPLAQKSMKWYQKLLANTPVIFFLSQNQRLMAESNLRGLNHPFDKFSSRLGQICRRYVDDSNVDKRIRNYHLTNLVTTDIFQLAIASEARENASAATDGDGLGDRLAELRRPDVVGPNHEPFDLAMLAQAKIKINFPIRQVERALSGVRHTLQLPEVFPYDIHYKDMYMLTIESLIFQDNHEALLDLIAQQTQFDVFAVRISKTHSPQFDLSMTTEPTSGPSTAPTYDQLLDWAEKQHHPSELRHVTQLLERLGHWGLVEVEENGSGSAFYVFKDSKHPAN